jgi:hypothetical protein
LARTLLIRMNKDTLLKTYNLLWNDLKSLYGAAGVVAKGDIQIDAKSTAQCVVVSTLCYLSGCKYKPSSPKTIDILLQSSESYVVAEEMMCLSNVRLLYHRKHGEEVETVLPLHYDFDPKVKGGHPIFHAQLDTYKFSKAELARVNFRATIRKSENEWFSNVRIPTPCMNFGSTLLSLTADHFPPATFDQVIKLLRKSDMIKWDANCSALKSSIQQGGGYLPSHHWYEVTQS